MIPDGYTPPEFYQNPLNRSSFGEFTEQLLEAAERAKDYLPCMCLSVNEDGKSVELVIDTAVSTYLDWIPGEGGDIGLLRCMETHRVIGINIPLRRNNLMVQHQGPIRINAGFRKDDAQ